MQPKPLFFLADDDRDDQEFFIAALQEIDPSLECVVANDGREALEKLQAEQMAIPDFIFLDQNMPRMTGMQCLVEIRKLNAFQYVPIIIYSTSIVKGAEETGASYFFQKTSSFSALKAYLRNLIGR